MNESACSPLPRYAPLQRQYYCFHSWTVAKDRAVQDEAIQMIHRTCSLRQGVRQELQSFSHPPFSPSVPPPSDFIPAWKSTSLQCKGTAHPSELLARDNLSGSPTLLDSIHPLASQTAIFDLHLLFLVRPPRTPSDWLHRSRRRQLPCLHLPPAE